MSSDNEEREASEKINLVFQRPYLSKPRRYGQVYQQIRIYE
jgi:hypothetical protein